MSSSHFLASFWAWRYQIWNGIRGSTRQEKMWASMLIRNLINNLRATIVLVLHLVTEHFRQQWWEMRSLIVSVHCVYNVRSSTDFRNNNNVRAIVVCDEDTANVCITNSKCKSFFWCLGLHILSSGTRVPSFEEDIACQLIWSYTFHVRQMGSNFSGIFLFGDHTHTKRSSGCSIYSCVCIYIYHARMCVCVKQTNRFEG